METPENPLKKIQGLEKDLFTPEIHQRKTHTPVKHRFLMTVLGMILSLVCGCGTNKISLERYPEDTPLVVVSDGLFSEDARNFFSKLCKEENVPYVGADCISWYKNKPAIEQAHKQGRAIILIGYSAGTDQARLTAEWCNKKGVSVHELIYFDPTHLTYWGWVGIPENVENLTNYLSERDILDVVWMGKGREVKASDMKNPDTRYSNYELKGPHIGIFRNNEARLRKDFKELIDKYKNSYKRIAYATRK